MKSVATVRSYSWAAPSISSRLVRAAAMVLVFLGVSFCSAAGQNKEMLKSALKENRKAATPQLAGASPITKPAISRLSALTVGSRVNYQPDAIRKSTNSPILSSQGLLAKVASTEGTAVDATIFSGVLDQKAPSIAGNGNTFYAAFENPDTAGGYPYGRVDIYQSINAGTTWSFWNNLSSEFYPLTSPHAILVGTDLVLAYRRNGMLRTLRFDAASTYPNPDVPSPTSNADEYVVDFHIVSDAEQYTSDIYLYMAYLFQQADGKNKVLFTRSIDTARTWQPYDSLALSEPELGVSCIGFDYSSSGLYVAYLGTESEQGNILMQKSTDLGASWNPEVRLPQIVLGGTNKKVGPKVSAMSQRVVLAYQYDWSGGAASWKSGVDFDVYGLVSSDGGETWGDRMIAFTPFNEILPDITHDADGNFYASYLRDGKVHVNKAAGELNFGVSDSSTTTSVSLDYFPSSAGSSVTGTDNVYSVWTVLSNGLDIYGSVFSPHIPPLTPSNVTAAPASTSQINLTWSDNSSDENSFHIFGAPAGTTGFTISLTVTANITSSQVTGLNPSTQYNFYVMASSAYGGSLYSNLASATTFGSPASPTNLTAMNTHPGIYLEWVDAAINETGYRIERRKNSGGGYSQIDTVGADVYYYQDNNVAPNTTYYYRVCATNSYGNSQYSNEIFITSSSDINPPAISDFSSFPGAVMVSNGLASAQTISAQAVDNETGVASFTLQYIRPGDSHATTLSFPAPHGGTQSLQIPGNAFVLPGGYAQELSYRLTATDSAGNFGSTSWYSLAVRNGSSVGSPGSLPAAASYSSAQMQRAYRIFSIPYDLDDKKLSSFMPQSLGAHSTNGVNYSNWRLQKCAGTDPIAYPDYEILKDDVLGASPGNAYWLIVRDASKRIILGNNKVIDADFLNSTGVTLSAGWNLVGTPSARQILFDSLAFPVGTYMEHAYYDGTGPVGGWYVGAGTKADTLRPWEGVAVKMYAEGTVQFHTLGAADGFPKRSLSVGQMRLQKSALLTKSPNWIIPVAAYRADIDMWCRGGGLGMVESAERGQDDFDVFMPPFVGQSNIEVVFENVGAALLRDIRPLNEDGGVWDMRVVTGDADAPVTLQFGDASKIPNPSFETYLIDLDLKLAYDLKTTSSLEISSGSGVRNFRIVAGKQSFAEQNNAGVTLMPTEMKLYDNYPNPFNPETSIRYAVPNGSPSYQVALKIYNVLGQEVKTLVNVRQNTGYYEVKWNANRMGSGIYFYEITVSDGNQKFQAVKKMALMK